MIDLISDTVTLPDEEMLKTILSSPLGDAGRIGADRRGEDETTNRLEDMAASITGKEEAAFFPSGTMANTAAILAFCPPESEILVDENQHILRSEKICFEEAYFRMKPVCYRLAPEGGPDMEQLENLLNSHKIRLLCLEDTHNFSGGICIPLEKLQDTGKLAKKAGIPIHLDGARLFHAAEAQGVVPSEICEHADTVMFCISKGLGAPIGSLLCGSREQIWKAVEIRKLLGGTMRQSGVTAACGIYALEHQLQRLSEDRENAQLVARALDGAEKISVSVYPQTNILLIHAEKAGLTGAELCERLLSHGIRGMAVSETEVRLVFHKGIERKDAEWAAEELWRMEIQLRE